MVSLGSDLQRRLPDSVRAIDVETGIQREQIPQLLHIPQVGSDEDVTSSVGEPKCGD
eukprot:CAMPEP_0204441926 /NCGR_PEP_ID=MMETSP0470-20130426/86139_1 /ASSEMBLY_ACC=CAM_ASM_000385 /TAXON_ID=2969 /ORGANISM="Oxyrrhis marina" /LENGTH=56 /DNA_ID=CAMNT_0051441099 /DNA_START=117 /DNA_END=287 /DNA_ORIENTATION=-